MRNETKGTRKSCDKHIHVSNRGDVHVANSSCETHCAMMQVALDTEVMGDAKLNDVSVVHGKPSNATIARLENIHAVSTAIEKEQ